LLETPEEREMVERVFTSQEAREILIACSDDDWASIGFDPSVTRPETMIPSVLAVPPPCVRPAVVNEARCRGQDDLTHILQSINKRAVQLRRLMDETPGAPVGAPPAVEERIEDDEEPPVADDDVIDGEGQVSGSSDGEESQSFTDAEQLEISDIFEKLQGDVCALYNNTSRARGQTLQRSGAPTRTLKHRLCGKHGRIRENIQGKRTNQSARSVVSPDPTLDVDEVGIPERVACTLTIPEPVNCGNIDELQRRVLRGAGRLDGAAAVILRDGAVIDLEMCPSERRKAIQLCTASRGSKGDIVERYLQDRDVVVFNRQPSLHKFGMMGHYVKIMKQGVTFRLSELSAPPYNADFDGDEMNIHVPQGPDARAEVAELMLVSKLLISPQSNKPVIGLVQDSLLGAYLLTADATWLTVDTVTDLFAHLRDPTMYRLSAPRGEGERPYHGRDVISSLLPPIDMSRGGVEVRDGRLVRGQLSKATVGSGAGGIVQIISQDFGSERAARFLSDAQSIIMRYLSLRGFSIGISACVVDDDVARRVHKEVEGCVDAAESIIADTDEYQSCGIEKEAEAAVVRVASGAIGRVGPRVAEGMDDTNPLMAMITAGSKGNPVNYTQIAGCVGQQCVEGQRIAVGRDTALPGFTRGDNTLIAHGFVKNSYIQGLEPAEVFFHAMGGREGLVDTAVKTAETGYMQRRAIKGLEDKSIVHVPHDRAMVRCPVASASGRIIQFHYGGDNCDASRLEKIRMQLFLDTALARAAWAGPADAAALEEARDDVVGDRAALVGVTMDDYAHLPVSIERALLRHERYARTAKRVQDTTDAGAARRRAVVDTLVRAARRVMTRCGAAELVYTIRYWLCEKVLCAHGLANQPALECLCMEIKNRICDATIAPGEMVGIVTAQMIGEKFTQMTLNTFHLAGIHQTQGIARIRELIDVSKCPKTPMTRIILRGTESGASQHICHKLKHVTVGTVATQTHFVEVCEGTSLYSRCALCLATSGSHGEVPRSALVIELGTLQLDAHRLTAYDVMRSIRRVCPSDTIVLLQDGGVVIAPQDDIVPLRLRREFLGRLSNKLRLACSIHGLPGVRAAAVRCVSGSSDGGSRGAATVIEMSGGSFTDAMMLPYTVWEQCYTNNVTQVAQVLGIEAARSVLNRELNDTISYDGTYLNDRHTMLLADSMCHRGYVMPMSRHGINRDGSGEVLKQCSYEETLEVLSRAALEGDIDNMRGITPCVAMGRTCDAMGTGSAIPYVAQHLLGGSDRKKIARRKTPREDETKRPRLAISAMSKFARTMGAGDQGATVPAARADGSGQGPIAPAVRPRHAAAPMDIVPVDIVHRHGAQRGGVGGYRPPSPSATEWRDCIKVLS
jgi:DNA-directed RNA polymerase II subunit RPB1